MTRKNSRAPDPALCQGPSPDGGRFDGITARAVVLGLGFVVFIAAFSPYNDFVLQNTRFIGNHFPIGITSLMLILVLALNPLLRWLRPGASLRCSELIVIWTMCLVGAAFPITGLLRQLIPWLIAPIYYLTHHPEWLQLLEVIPNWMFPTTDPANDDVITGFMLGSDPGQPLAVPWGAWVGPLARWGLYYVPLFLGMMLFAVLISRQWIVHEKLQYPIASLMLDMVRDAPRGRRLNALFTNRLMWAGATVVMAIHLINGLHAIFPKVPQILLGYNLNEILTEGFWPYYKWYVRSATVYFSMVGIAFLMASHVSLSLWFFLLLFTTIAAIILYHGVDPYDEIHTQSKGATLAMGGMLLFMARAHLWRALRLAFLPVRDHGDREYTSYRWVVWGLMLCVAAAIFWQWCTGLPLPLAIAQVAMVFLSHIVMARIVAETGMFFVPGGRPPLFWSALPAHRVLWFNNAWSAARTAETLLPYVFNGLWLRHAVSEQERAKVDRESTGRSGFVGFVGVMLVSMLLSMVIGSVVWLAIYYSEGLVRTNAWIGIGWSVNICKDMMKMLQEIPTRDVRAEPLHLGIGAAAIILLGLCRWYIPRWPLVPIALCMGISNELGFMWLSILIGWACKVIVMRTGGVTAYQRLRPLFLGMVFGEVVMGGVWMAVGAIARLNGLQLNNYQVLPGN